MVVLWDTSTFVPLKKLKAHGNAVFGIAFSPDGRRLATGALGGDAIPLWWDLATGRELVTLPATATFLRAVAFSPDDNWLVASDWDKGPLHLWHAPSWAETRAAQP
jgi:WD40 repeat protein